MLHDGNLLELQFEHANGIKYTVMRKAQSYKVGIHEYDDEYECECVCCGTLKRMPAAAIRTYIRLGNSIW